VKGAAVAVAALGLMFGACSLPPSPSPALYATPLPTPTSSQEGCADLGWAGFTVVIDAADPRLVWFDNPAIGRMDVYWPGGYGIRLEPEAVVVSASGEVLFRDGEYVTDSYGVCRGPGQSIIWHSDERH
jgi:hypothetical protein